MPSKTLIPAQPKVFLRLNDRIVVVVVVQDKMITNQDTAKKTKEDNVRSPRGSGAHPMSCQCVLAVEGYERYPFEEGHCSFPKGRKQKRTRK